MTWYVFIPLVVVVTIGAVIAIALRLEHRQTATGQLTTRTEAVLYRFSFLDAQDRPGASEEIELTSLLDAIARAHMMLKQRPHHDAVEVWLGNRCAYRARRDQAA